MSIIQIVEKAKANNQRYVELIGAGPCEMAHQIAKSFVETKMRCRGINAAQKREANEKWLKEAVSKWAEKFGRSALDFVSITGIDHRTGEAYKEKSYGAFRSCSYHAYKAI